MIALQRQVLKAVIQDQDIGSQFHGTAGRKLSGTTGQNRDAGQGLGQQPRLITGIRGLQHRDVASGNNIASAPGRSAIASADNCRMAALALQQPGYILHQGRFAGAAHGQIADADHRHREPDRRQQPDPVQRSTQDHQQAVQGGQGATQGIE